LHVFRAHGHVHPRLDQAWCQAIDAVHRSKGFQTMLERVEPTQRIENRAIRMLSAVRQDAWTHFIGVKKSASSVGQGG
jgi:hypothetical protein